MPRTYLIVMIVAFILPAGQAKAADYFLTIGGGFAPTSNQVSLEKNVLLMQQTLDQLGLSECSSDVYFSDGAGDRRDVQVVDRFSVPKAHRLMAEFFGSEKNLGLMYRNHEIPNVNDAATPSNVRAWFREMAPTMTAGDRLVLYVAAHGHRSNQRQNEYDTTIAMWGNTSLKMSELVQLLDELPNGVEVVAVMVQCYSGGFARFIFNDGDPHNGLSPQARTGFFATVHDRAAAGCTSEINEANYVEYSTYFWSAFTGVSRSGKQIQRPDFNKDGVISFDEAHAYTILTANTIDVPIKTSGEFLAIHSRFRADLNSNLLTDDEPYDLVLSLASTTDRAVLEGLSRSLKLTGTDRISKARKESRPRRRSRSRRRRPSDPSAPLRRKIANDVKRRWPELANVLNPACIRLLTAQQRVFVSAIEGHPDYARYRELTNQVQSAQNDQKRRAKYERFYRTADNVVLAENLKRLNADDKLRQYQRLLQIESGTFRDPASQLATDTH